MLKPFFSIFSIASSEVPILLHSVIKLFKSLFFLAINLDKGWSGAIAIKLAPKIVSGLVVYISIVFMFKFNLI